MYPASVPAPPPYYRTEVGAFAGSPSAYGTFDQTGNVAERNEGTSSCPRGRGDAGVRGGAWLVYDPWDDECWELTSGGWRCGSAQADPKIGFRVGKVAPVDPLNSGTLQFKLASDMP